MSLKSEAVKCLKWTSENSQSINLNPDQTSESRSKIPNFNSFLKKSILNQKNGGTRYLRSDPHPPYDMKRRLNQAYLF